MISIRILRHKLTLVYHPSGALPRLNGYYCESCPAGFAPRGGGVETYGCSPCPVDTYKALDGEAGCVACAADQFTNGTVGSTMCVAREGGTLLERLLKAERERAKQG